MSRATELEAGVDYFYCQPCDVHVPCVQLGPGEWEVQCPHCEGTCGLCDCSLRDRCFGAPEGPTPLVANTLRLINPAH